MKQKEADILKSPKLLHDRVPHPQETSQSICRENQLVGLCIIMTSPLK